MPNDRVQWIDFAKGFAIILVVAAHVMPKNDINDLMSAFRMPFFFVMAGYLLNAEKWGRRWQEFKSKLYRRLLLPYFLSNFLWYPIWFIACYLLGDLAIQNWTQRNQLGAFLAIFIGNNYNLGVVLLLYPLWFLPCLLYAELIYLKLHNYFGARTSAFLKAIFILSAAGYVLGFFLHLPLGIDIAFAVQIFILAGRLIKKYELVDKLNFGACLILLALPFLEIWLSGYVDMNKRIYGNFILFYAAGIAGSLLVMKISVLLTSFSNKFCDFISYCGRQSLMILILHVPIIEIVYQATLLIASLNSEFSVRILFPEFYFVLLICGVLIPVWIAKNFGKAPVIKNFCV